MTSRLTASHTHLWAKANGDNEQALRYAGERGRLSWRALDSRGEVGRKVMGVVTDGVTRVRAELEIGASANIKNVRIALTDPDGNGGLCLTNKEDDPCKETSVTAKLVSDAKTGKLVLDPNTPVYYKGPESFVRSGDKKESDEKVPVASGTADPITISPGKWNALSSVVDKVPAHMITGFLPIVMPDIASALSGGMSLDMWWLQQVLAESCGLSREVVFGVDRSDGLVPSLSQSNLYGGSSSYVTEIHGVDHVSVVGSDKTVDAVRKLLEEPMDLSVWINGDH